LRFTKVVIFAAFWGLLLLAGCSTTNHAPAPTMVYHDLTGHYNSYFNAKEKLKGIYATMDKIHKDNYKEVIPLYTYSDPKEAATVSGDCDDIEKRVTYNVQVHKVSNWADDDFLIMGKANYIKGNYEKAQSFIKYTTTEYKNGVDYVKERKKEGKVAKPTLKKKPAKKPHFEQKLDEKGNMTLVKIDERPSYSFFIHEPARAEALLWLAKTYGAQNKFAEATAVIQFARSDDKFYKNLDKDLEATDAELLLRQKNYSGAIAPLEKFLTMTKKKSERVRPIYILAQIYELQGNYSKASQYYQEVLKNRPNYDMEFYAKIRRAKLGSKSGGSEDVRKLLVQMSRDGKYKDYLDQIYYELGQIALTANNREEARKDFKKSVATSTKNADQKALSYLQLARMDYEDEAYVSSKFYYDTTMQNMAKNDTAYAGVESRDKTLDKLVKQINIIAAEDSLQRVAAMAPADRLKFIHKLLDKKQQEEDDKKAAKEGSKATNTDFIKGAGGTTPGVGGTEDPASQFYFYNTTAKGNGYNEFIKRWGRRKLEDNWRRKDKAINTETADATDSAALKKAAADSASAGPTPSSEEEKMLAGLPLTPDKMDKSNGKLVDAYYAMGTVYKDDLQANRKSVNAYEELNRRFPKNKLELESFYQLYLLHTKLKNTTKADYYKQQILSLYPNSTIAKYLTDPNFLAEANKKENALSYYYESAYSDYASGQYASASQKVLDVDAQFKENKMRAKFDLLNALILSKENRLSDYVDALNKIIAKYPGTPEKDQAQRWLNDLNHSKLPQVDLSKMPKDSLGNVIGDAPPSTALFTDTAGNADFLKKVEGKNPGKPNKPVVDTKPAPKDTTPVKPYVPLTAAEKRDSVKAAQDAIAAKVLADRKAKQDSIAAAIVAKKAAQDSVIAHNIAARKATQDSLANVAAANKAAKEAAIARNIAAKKHVQDSIAGAKAPKTTVKEGGNPNAAQNNAKQDSINAKIAARKAIQDSIAAKTVADKKAAQDAINAKIAAKKLVQDSIAAKTLADKKAAQDAINAKIVAKKSTQDSITAKTAAAQKAKQDSINLKRGIKPAAKDTPVNKAPVVNKPKTLQEKRDSMLAARAQDSIAKKSAVNKPKTLQERRDSMLTAKNTQAAKDSIAKKSAKPVVKEQPKAKPATKDTVVKKPEVKAKPATKDTVKAAPKVTPVAIARPTFDTDTLTDVYGKTDNAPHYVIIYFLDPSVASTSTAKLSAFNAATFAADNLTAQTVNMDKDNNLINIKRFQNKDAAMAYITALKGKLSETFPTLNENQYFIGAISTLNYSTLVSTKKINNYQRFYRANYK
jgi:tetratricopeptide (TPR) repeat protein